MAISEAEAQVMEVLWQQSPCTAETVLEVAGARQGWQEGTVKSLLNRLLRKGAVAAEREGRRYLYRPLLSREAYLAEQSRGLLERLFGGRLAPFVAQFSERQALSQEDLAELRRLLDRLESRGEGSDERG